MISAVRESAVSSEHRDVIHVPSPSASIADSKHDLNNEDDLWATMSEIHMEDLADLDQPHTSIIQETVGASSLSPISDPTAMPFYKELMSVLQNTFHLNSFRV